jgi:hypothetical protein
MSAKTRRATEARNNSKKPLDRGFEKRGPGRPRQAEPAEVIRARSENYRVTLSYAWPKLWPGLSKARDVDAVAAAWSAADLSDGEGGFVRLSALAPQILEVLKDRRFHQKRGKAQATYLANSLAALGRVSPRRSRDIASQPKPKSSKHTIQHAEPVFEVECSCGFRGLSKALACGKCGARIPLFWLTK